MDVRQTIIRHLIYRIKVYAVAIFLCDSRSLHPPISAEPIFDRNERFEYETAHTCDRMRHIIGTRGKPTAYFPRLRSTARNGRRGDVLPSSSRTPGFLPHVRFPVRVYDFLRGFNVSKLI
jgi:hypothetical protein